MANEKTPAEVAQRKVEAEKIAMQLRATDAEYRTLSRNAAIEVGATRHAAFMEDHSNGNLLAREIAKFSVKLAVADLAKANGRKPNGEMLDAPKLGDVTGKAQASEAGETANA